MIKRTAKFSFMELREYCKYRNERINSSELDTSNYISTENILPNKGGIANATSIPSGNVVRYDKGNILISNIRPYFKKIWLADKSGGCSADVLCIKAKDNISSKYLYYLLSQQSFFDYVMAGAKGCKMPRGDKSHIMDWEVNVPSITEQKRIADFLSSLDDKIELNRRINDNLEQQAQALFKSWFVDFEPFKDGEFVDSELGMIPKGWRVVCLDEICDVVGGGTPSKSNPKYYCNNGISWITPKDLSITHAKFTSKGEIDITDNGYSNSSAKLMPCGSVLFSSRAPIGYISIATRNLCTNQGFKSLVPKIAGTCFLYLYLKENTNAIESQASGSTFKEASGSLIKAQKAIIPNDLQILNKFEETSNSIFESQKNLENQICLLQTLRDSLLPRIMSGELKINDLNC